MNRIGALRILTANVFVGAILASSLSLAHHAFVAFDNSRTIEVSGIIEEVFWANPHIRLAVRTADDTVWDLEGPSVNLTERNSDIREESFPVGAEASFTGFPSRRGGSAMRPILARLSTGQVVPVDRMAAERLGLLDETASPPVTAGGEPAEDAIRNANGIFRVWFPTGRTAAYPPGAELPLTDAARAAKASWSQEEDGLAVRCIQAGLPEAMLTPFPMELTDRGDTIVIRLEEWDNVRTIYMQDASRPENLASPHLGYSVGRWEDGVLLVTTTDIDYPFLDDRGTPLSEVAEISETFEMSDDETRLDWSATVVDPETFTEPVALSIVHFEWRPEVQIRPYNCTLYQE